MTITYTTLLGLAKPVTGTEANTWGDVVNDQITSLLDSAIAGTTTLTTDTTLTTTTGAANTSRQAVLLCSPASANITITAPAQSKIYTVINTSATYTVTVRGVGPTTGVTLGVSEKAVVAWNGSDFIKISNTAGAGAFTTLSVSGVATFSAGTAAAPAITTTGDTNTGIFFPAADTIAFAEGGAEAMRIDSSSRVLIGSTSSVGNANANNLELTNPAGSGVCGLTLNVASASANTGNIYWRSNASNNAIQIVGDPITNYFAVATAGSERMRIDSSGNVGIGTSSPQRTLHVENSSGNLVRLNNSSTANGSFSSIELTSTGGNNCQIRGVQDSSTAGHLQFYTKNAGAVAERLRIDSSGNVGIGTSSPSDKLTVISAGTQVGSTNFRNIARIGLATNDASVLLGYNVGDGSGILSSTNNFPLAFWTSNAGTYAERARIDSSGNLGLGVTPPTSTDAGNITIKGGSTLNFSTASGNMAANATFNSGWKYIATAAAVKYTQSGAEHQWFNAPSGTAGNAITFTQAMTLDASGNLGIGTASPAANSLTIASKNAVMTSGYGMSWNSGATQLAGYDTNILQFITASTERMRIDSSGNVGIGTSSPTSKLTVDGAFSITGQGRSTTGWAVSADGSTFTPSGLNAIPNYGTGYITSTSFTTLAGFGGASFYTNQLERMRIDGSGNVGIGTASPASFGSPLSIYLAANPTLAIVSGNANAYLRLYSTSDNNMYLTNTGGAMTMNTANTERMRIDSSGKLLVGVTSATSGGGVLQVSNGITFPATQSASSNANTLDDYEEGTWTPTDGSGAGLSFTVNSATYTKIGNTVRVSFYGSYPTTANTNGASMSGLPFTVSNYGSASILSSGSAQSALVRGVLAQTKTDVKALFSDTTVTNNQLSGQFLIFTLVYIV
jgi:hypothetical protein